MSSKCKLIEREKLEDFSIKIFDLYMNCKDEFYRNQFKLLYDYFNENIREEKKDNMNDLKRLIYRAMMNYPYGSEENKKWAKIYNDIKIGKPLPDEF